MIERSSGLFRELTRGKTHLLSPLCGVFLVLSVGILPAKESPVRLEKSFSFVNKTFSGTFPRGSVSEYPDPEFSLPFELTEPGSEDTVTVKTCSELRRLAHKEWYGSLTFSTGQKNRQLRRCGLIHGLQKLQPYRNHYFNTSPDSWWRDVPVSVVSVPGGIYSEESWEEARRKLRNRREEARTVTQIGKVWEVG